MVFQQLIEQEQFSTTPTTPEFYIKRTHARARAPEALKNRRVVHVVSDFAVVPGQPNPGSFCGQPFPAARSASGFAGSAVIARSHEMLLLDTADAANDIASS